MILYLVAENEQTLKLNKVKLESKNYYYNTQFAKCKNNLKATWKLIGSIIKRKTKGQIHPTKITINNKIYTAKQDIVNQLNQYFVNVGPNLANSITTSSLQPISYINNVAIPSFFMSPITETQVLNLFLGLDSNKVSIDIPNNMIKIAAYELSPIFTNIFNESISTGVVPDILKISRITPIYKSGDTNEPHNYRPISILSVFSKVLERLVYNQLDSFLEKYNIMYNYQFGFRKKHSTEQAILELTDKLKSAIDNKQLTCGLFLDFSKAFDTVNHKILLEKLQKYGIRGVPLQWFTSYLTNRQQYVRINTTDSEMLRMTCGVPQGSTLGPLLFLLYINDMPNCSKKLSFRIFADDTNVFYSGKSVSEIEIVMNEEIKKIHNYCAINKLSINFKKTNFMIIGSKQKKIGKIQIGNIEQTQYIKYLGMYIDKHITWEQQIKHVKAKISKNTGIINKLRYYLDLNTLKQLYYTLIYPFINYGLMSWGNTYTSHLTKLRTALNKCIRSIFFAQKREDATPYYSLLGILKLDNVFKLKIANFTYQILNEPSNVPDIFSTYVTSASASHTYNTRFASKENFSRPKVRTNYGKFTFQFASSKIWESVDYTIKKSNSSYLFKKHYKQSLLLTQM